MHFNGDLLKLGMDSAHRPKSISSIIGYYATYVVFYVNTNECNIFLYFVVTVGNTVSKAPRGCKC